MLALVTPLKVNLTDLCMPSPCYPDLIDILVIINKSTSPYSTEMRTEMQTGI